MKVYPKHFSLPSFQDLDLQIRTNGSETYLLSRRRMPSNPWDPMWLQA